MKKVIYFCSFFCGLTALITFVMGIRVLMGRNFLIGLRIFNMISNGTLMGVIGNLIGVAITCLGFGALAVYGFGTSQTAKKNSFIYGLIMTGICVVSMISAIFVGKFTMGDLYIALLPAIYTFAVLKSA